MYECVCASGAVGIVSAARRSLDARDDEGGGVGADAKGEGTDNVEDWAAGAGDALLDGLGGIAGWLRV